MTETIAYLVHDLSDAAVRRRVRMLELGGAAVRLAGFRRSATAVNSTNIPFLELGQTADAKLASRAGSVAKAWGRIERLRGTVAGADIIIARNLEMLLLAA